MLISVRRHAANTHTHIKLTWKTETGGKKRETLVLVFFTLLKPPHYTFKKQFSYKILFQNEKQAHSLCIHICVALLPSIPSNRKVQQMCTIGRKSSLCNLRWSLDKQDFTV